MKRGLALALSSVAIGVVGILWTSPPAVAKGPSQGIITGPGLSEPITLREPGAATIGPDLAKVLEQSRFSLSGSDGGRLAHRPAGDLGPRYTITYDMTLSDRLSGTIVQYVYPYAEPLPITYMPGRQTYWGTQETVGAWYAARTGLRQTLIDVGLPASASPQPAAGSEAGPSAVSRPAGSILTGLVVATVFLALALVAILMRRNRLPL
jgi:hypothetical protein